MTEERELLQREELEDAEGEPLPDREVMSVISSGFDDPMPLPMTQIDPLKGGEEL